LPLFKKGILGLFIAFLLFIPATAWGLSTPTISANHGVALVSDIDNLGWNIGGEYGVLENLAIIADLRADHSRVGVKVLINPEFAFLGGFRNSNIFIGVNFGTEFMDKFSGMGEVDIFQSESKTNAEYEVGCKLSLTEQLDIRSGLVGEINESGANYNLMFGLGYSF
jgi:hypothetical protein